METDPAPAWRARSLDVLLSITVGVIAVLLVIWIPLRPPPRVDVSLMALVASAIAMAGLRLSGRVLNHEMRAGATFVCYFAVGMTLIGQVGFAAAGAVLLVSATVTLSALLLRPRVAVVFLALMIAGMLTIGLLMDRGALVAERQEEYESASLRNWLRIILVTGGITAAVAATVFAAVREIERSADAVRSALDELQAETRRRVALEDERRKAEVAIAEARRLETVGRLAGGVAHDFNNSLVAILGWADLVLGRARRGAPLEGRGGIEEGLKNVNKAATQASHLTRQLLAFARREVLDPRPLDVNAAIQGTTAALTRLLTDDVRIRFEPGRGLPPILGDEGRLAQILMNLAANARDAMPSGGTFGIETRLVEAGLAPASAPDAGARYVEVVVRDSGVGMDAATRARIFEPFFTTKGPGRGTGLGLASVQGAVAQGGGYVGVESEPGRGTTFTLGFPAASAEARAPSPSERAAPASGRGGAGRRVLLAEDEPLVRDTMSTALRSAGFDVIEAATGDGALEAARRHKGELDLLCTDGIMPGLPTSRLIEAFQELFPRAAVLVCSGYVEEELLRRGIEERALGFLAKPFTGDALVARALEVIDAARLAAPTPAPGAAPGGVTPARS